MLRDTSPGTRLRGVPALGSAHRQPAGRKLWLGASFAALVLAVGPSAAQTVSLNASTSAFSEPCSSAKAVHDMRCPNYTGFKTRLGGDAARTPAVDEGAPHLVAPRQPALGLRAGRDLGRGVASWYGPGFHGRKTANGERFNMHEMTAAHKTLPFGTRVLVQNPRTGKEVVVRINDRGPFIKGRVIDLSKAAAKALGIHARGHAAVVLREAVPARGPAELLASGQDS